MNRSSSSIRCARCLSPPRWPGWLLAAVSWWYGATCPRMGHELHRAQQLQLHRLPGAFRLDLREWRLEPAARARRPSRCRADRSGACGAAPAATTGTSPVSVRDRLVRRNRPAVRRARRPAKHLALRVEHRRGRHRLVRREYVDAIDKPAASRSAIRARVAELVQQCRARELSGRSRRGAACLSACTRYNTDQFCCRGAFGTPDTCVVSDWAASAQTYVNNVHNFCPRQYSYAYDEISGGALHTCPTGANYTITFCP